MSLLPRVLALLALARVAALALTIAAPAFSVAHAADDRRDGLSYLELLHERKLRQIEARLEQQKAVRPPASAKQSDAAPAASTLPAA